MKKTDRGAESAQVTYMDHFGMARRPFGLTPDPDFFFESQSHSEALRRLRSFIKEEGGLALVYGDVGTGKTLVCRRLLSDSDGLTFNSALIVNPLMDARELLLDIAGQFGISPPPLSTHEGLSAALADFFLHEQEKGKVCVLAIDEAQLLSEDALAVLADLSRHDAAEGGALRTILFGQEDIAARLLDRGMEQLRRNITVTHYLQPLSGDEVRRYIRHRLSKSGANGSISFTDDALKRIYAASKGYPRIVNGICDKSLLVLAQRSKNTVDRGVVNRALTDELITPVAARGRINVTGRVLYGAVLILAGVLILCGLFLYLRPTIG